MKYSVINYIVLWIALLGLPLCVSAMGNHPTANNCPPDKPYQAICTSSLHSLEGWYGSCYATEAEAQAEADHHAKQEHGGNSRWTGINKERLQKHEK